MVSVPRLTDGLVVCLGTGPSLTREDVESCRGRATVVAVNDSWRLAPWAEVLFAHDSKWWSVHRGVPEFHGLKFALEPVAMKYPDVCVLRSTGRCGIETDPTGLRHGRNSGYAAMNLAVNLGASRIVLLGYDMRKGPSGEWHFFGDHPAPLKNDTPFAACLETFASAVAPLQSLGIDVVNCTPGSALTLFPQMALSDALQLQAVPA